MAREERPPEFRGERIHGREHDPDGERGDDEQGEAGEKTLAQGEMLLLVDALRFCGQAGRRVRLDQGRKKDIPGVEAGQHQTRNEGAFVHFADGAAQLVGHDDENERGRNDLRQRAGGCDDARGEPPVVAVAQHDGQRDQAH